MANTQPAANRWSSRLAFICATTGAAVGLGNIWKFPYMAGDHGGGAFVLMYLLCVLCIAIPIMIAEIVLGRCGRADPVTCLQQLAKTHGASRYWAGLGWWGAGTLILVLSFYSVVAGWSLAYLQQSLTGSLNQQTAPALLQHWQQFLAQPLPLLGWHALFMGLTVGVVSLGIKNGLERANTWMMPALLAILIGLVVYGYQQGDMPAAWHFLFSFHLDKLNAQVIIDALGHACFSLATGAGCLLVYGAYLPEEVPIGSTALIIAGLNLMIAILAGLAIFPLVFAHHLAPQEGPGLMFEILPIAFAQMPYGQWIGALFFLLLLFAAWTSSISLAEPLVQLLITRRQLTRTWASGLVGLVAWSLGILSTLSFNLWSDVRILGHWTLFTAATDLATNLLLPIGALGFALFAGWCLPSRLIHPLLGKAHRHNWLWTALIRTLAPMAILIILIAPGLTGHG